MWSLSTAQLLEKGLKPASRWCIILGAATLVLVMISVVVSVISRSGLRISLAGTIELVQVLLVIVFFAGMAYTELNKKHVTVDILVSRFSSTARLVITACGDLMSLGIIGIISWQSVLQAQYAWDSSVDTGILGIPLWPWAVLTAVFMALFAFTLLVDFFNSLGELISGGTRNCLWLIPGIIVTLVLFAMSFWPGIFLPIKITPQTFGTIAILLMFVLIFLNVRIGAAMAMITLWGMGYLNTPGAGLALLGMTSQSTAGNYIWSVLPLFMWMGLLVSSAELSKDLYNAAYKWLGQLHGGLAGATVGACAAFAAVVGDPMSGAVTMTTVALPQMRKYKYDVKLATGAIAAGSTLGVLIPPSVSFIVYGLMVEQSIGRLFIAGIIPGILIAISLILLIMAQCRINPSLGPPGPVTTFREKAVSLTNIWPVLILFLLVIGGIYTGIFTATEAGAIGAFGTILIGLVMRRLTVRLSFNNAIDAAQMASMVFFIFIYAMAISQFLAITKLPMALANLVQGLEVNPYLILALVLFMYFILGCLMNILPMIILTLPIVYPLIISLGFDPIWFGVLVTVMSQVGTLTPPIGITVFVMSGMTDVPMYTIFRGVTPFWIIMFFDLAILVAFPQISLFLPDLMMGK